MKKKQNRALKLSRETLRRLDEHVLRGAHGGATLGCPSVSICSECGPTYVRSCDCEPTDFHC